MDSRVQNIDETGFNLVPFLNNPTVDFEFLYVYKSISQDYLESRSSLDTTHRREYSSPSYYFARSDAEKYSTTPG